MQSEATMNRVRWHLYHYWEIKKAVSRARAEMRRHMSSHIGGVQDSRLSDPTAAIAIQNATPLRSVRLSDGGRVASPEAWIDAIDAGLSAVDSETRSIARESFMSNRSWERILIDHAIERATLYRTRDKAVVAVAIAAAEAGLISLKEE